MCTTSALVCTSCTRGVQEDDAIGLACTPHEQEVHTKAEVVHLSPGLLHVGLGVFIHMSRI